MRAPEFSMPAHEARGRVVRHTVDPGAQRALSPESREAAPDGDMDVLQQVLLQTTIPLISSRQARDRRPKFGDGAGVEIVLTRRYDREVWDGAAVARRRTHVKGSRRTPGFLTTRGKLRITR
jgi:hypothetical protein